MKLIDKDAVVAWAKETYLCENASMVRKVCYKQLLEHLDSLEVKEVDLDKEIYNIWNPRFNLGWNENSLLSVNHKGFATIAKHFFELGLKAQKGGEV